MNSAIHFYKLGEDIKAYQCVMEQENKCPFVLNGVLLLNLISAAFAYIAMQICLVKNADAKLDSMYTM